MPVIFEHPGGVPRFHIDDHGGTVYEYGTTRAVGFIAEKTVFALDGTPAFWLGEDDDDCYLHPFDFSPPRFYFDFFDGKPCAPKPDEDVKPKVEDQKSEDMKLGKLQRKEKRRALSTAEFQMLVITKGRRAAIEVMNRAKTK